jgi:ribosomal protein S18 acetylase RimI-like enzyme
MMKTHPLRNGKDIQYMRELTNMLASASTIVDFEEKMQISSIRNTVRIWEQEDRVVGFAFIDDYQNLWLETLLDFVSLDQLEDEMITWGVTCLQQHNTETGLKDTLDCSCSATDNRRILVLKQHGFIQTDIRSLHYSRPLNDTVILHPLPMGFSIRPVKGRQEVAALVRLHRQAFGTDAMTIEYRLAMMNAPAYIPELDLLGIAPDGELAAFCVCGFDDSEKKIGYTDPIGTHPRYQKMGLGKALITAGLIMLKESGAERVRLGTSSENVAMQRLAESLDFQCVSEKLWFSKVVT